MLDQIIQFLVNGLVLGIIYSLVAVGFTLFFGVLNVIKFSHGDFLMLSCFLAIIVSAIFDFLGVNSFFVKILAIMFIIFFIMYFLGFYIAKILIFPLSNAPPFNILLITLMLGLGIRESVRLFYPNGSNPKPFPNLLSAEEFVFFDISVRIDSLIIIFLGLFTIIILNYYIKYTNIGMCIRAVSQDDDTAKLMGINIKKVVYMTFGIGSVLAAIAGVATGFYYNEINFNMGLLLGIVGFCSAVVGGLGNIKGALIGGFLFSFLQTIGAIFFLIPAYKDVFAFAVIIIIMTIRPSGILSESETDRA